MKRELICIRCPLGCRLRAEWNGQKDRDVEEDGK